MQLIADVYFRDTAHGFLAWAVAMVVHVEIYALIEDGTVSAAAMTCASRAPSPF
jgi:hypothetical protein